MTARCAILSIFACAQIASAQFTPMFLQNNSYWGDGKAEFDFYDAQIMRDGQMHSCEMLNIFVREIVDPKTFPSIENSNQPNALATIRMNEIFTAPRGIFIEQQSLTANWRRDSGELARLWLTGSDSVGNFSKRVEGNSTNWFFIYDTYRDGAGFEPVEVLPNKNAIFYDELPLRVRMIDFSKPTGEFQIQLAPHMFDTRPHAAAFKPATVRFKPNEGSIDIDIEGGANKEHFVLDRDFPFLLREWRAADGSHFKMKNSLRVDYLKYNKNGDRERALKDPMLRHPD